MKKIMFVCHGNICRSPMAEFVMKSLVKSQGLSNKFLICSSATSSEELGNPIYPPAKAVLYQHNIPFSEHFSAKLTPNDYDKYDLFILMDNRNLLNIRHIFKSDNEKKIHLLLEYTGEAKDVADPWYSGDFEKTYNDIYKGCEALLKALIQQDTKNLRN